MKLISILTPCYNEEENVADVYQQVKAVFDKLPQYDYEHLFIDNASTDRTVDILREITRDDPHVRVIINVRNFGHVRSPQYGMLQTRGDAVIGIVADLQDPPELIPEFLEHWEKGYPVVMGVKKSSRESALIFALRTMYYRTLRKLADVELVEHYYGFGLIDRQVVELIRGMKDPYPFFRGQIAELGLPNVKIYYDQPLRKRGKSQNNFYSLFDLAMLGMTSHTKVPLRLATITGFFCAALSLLVALSYLIYKLLFWNSFSVGMAPLVIGLFFFVSVQLAFLGIIGEYVGAIHTQGLKRPLVVEKERINFTDNSPSDHSNAAPISPPLPENRE